MMSLLISVLLETLPGWPEAPEVSTFTMLFITVLLPLAVTSLIIVLVFAPLWLRKSKGRDIERVELP